MFGAIERMISEQTPKEDLMSAYVKVLNVDDLDPGQVKSAR